MKFKLRTNFQFTERQNELIEKAIEPNTKMVVIDGLYGTGKTALAVFTALYLLQNEKRFDKIVYVRNAVEATKHGKIGYLPGTMEEKMAPYAAPFLEKVDEFTGGMDLAEMFEVASLGLVRGRTFRKSIVIVDEAANLTKDDFILLLSRCSDDVLVFVLGDSLHQSDIGDDGYLDGFCKLFDDEESVEQGIVVARFQQESDIVRGELIKFALKKLGKLGNKETGLTVNDL